MIQVNADLQRTAQRGKAFPSEQCTKLEESSRSGKARDLLRKTGDIKGTFCPKMGTIKDRNGRDKVDTEEVKKRWKECMKNCTKEILVNWITTMMWPAT